MELLDSLVFFRGLERLMVVAGGIVSIVCGMFLFKWGVGGEAKLLVRHKETQAQWVNATPGGIVILFGIAVLVVNTVWGLKIDGKTMDEGEQALSIQYGKPDDSSVRFLKNFLQATRDDCTNKTCTEQREKAKIIFERIKKARKGE